MKQKKDPLVSVFIPYYNDKKFLRQAIDSILNQTYQNFELILLNHASTDGSKEIANSYSDIRLKHINTDKNYGAGGGILFEKMLNTAKGEYIKPFCADDIMLPNCLKEMVSYMKDSPKTDFCFADVAYIDKNSKKIGETWFKARPYFSLKNTEKDLLRLYKNGISTLPFIGSFIKKEALQKISFDCSLIMLFDMSLWLQLLLNGKQIGYINKVLAGYRCHNEQISGLSNENISGRRSYFEFPVFNDFFANCQNIKLIKEIFKEDKYAKLLNNKKDIPFIVYHAYFTQKDMQIDCYKLHELLKNENYRQHLIQTFGYDIDVYRQEYSYPPTHPENEKEKCIHGLKKLKQHIYTTPSKKLNILELSFLMLRDLCKLITLAPIRKKKKQKKRYSL